MGGGGDERVRVGDEFTRVPFGVRELLVPRGDRGHSAVFYGTHGSCSIMYTKTKPPYTLVTVV